MKLKKNNSAEIEMKFLMEILLGVILLISMVYFVSNSLLDSYSSEVSECNFFMKNVDGRPKFFTSGLDDFSIGFIEAVSGFCPSKDVELKDKKLKDTADLILNCNKLIGSGDDFFGANVDNLSLCVHCGFVKVSSDIDNFNEKFSKELAKEKYDLIFSEDTELLNTNRIILTQDVLPVSVSDGDYYRILAYANKPEIVSYTDSFQTWVSSTFGKYGSSVVSYILSESSESGLYGVSFSKVDNFGEFDTSRDVGVSDLEMPISCDKVIIPSKNYD